MLKHYILNKQGLYNREMTSIVYCRLGPLGQFSTRSLSSNSFDVTKPKTCLLPVSSTFISIILSLHVYQNSILSQVFVFSSNLRYPTVLQHLPTIIPLIFFIYFFFFCILLLYDSFFQFYSTSRIDHFLESNLEAWVQPQEASFM